MNIASEYTQLIAPIIALTILFLGFLLVRANKHTSIPEDIYEDENPEESREEEHSSRIVSAGTVWYKKKYDIDTESYIPWIDTTNLVTVLQVRGDWLSIKDNELESVMYILRDEFFKMYMQDDYNDVQARAEELNNEFKRETPWFTEVSEAEAEVSEDALSPEMEEVININGKNYKFVG